MSRVHNNHTYSRRLSALRKLEFSSIKINPLNLESQTKLRTNPGFPEFPNQNLMQTCQGVTELWSDIQTNRDFNLYRWYSQFTIGKINEFLVIKYQKEWINSSFSVPFFYFFFPQIIKNQFWKLYTPYIILYLGEYGSKLRSSSSYSSNEFDTSPDTSSSSPSSLGISIPLQLT